MLITTSTIITAGALLSAAGAIIAAIVTIVKWFQKQDQQDKDIKAIKRELTMVIYALSASLDGLQQVGANHVVPEAKAKLDKYINQQAHDQLD